MKNKYIIFLLSILIFSCEKAELDDIDDIIDNQKNITINTHEVDIPQGVDQWILQQTLHWEHGNFYYIVNGTEYILIPGGAAEEKANPILFKKENNTWVVHKIFTNVFTEGVRQGYKINETTFIWADAAECYTSMETCIDNRISRPGNFIYLIKVNGDDLTFEKIGDEYYTNPPGGPPGNPYHHDVGYGDLDGDGDLDVISTDLSDIIYYQNNGSWDGTFYWRKEWDSSDRRFFSLEVSDLDGGLPEIIQTSYGDYTTELTHGFQIQKRNSEGKYEVVYETTESKHNTYSTESYGANRTLSIDINYDGIKDLLIQREGGGPSSNSLEIYFGNNDLTYTSNQLITNQGSIQWTSFDLMDVNNDGLLDIVFTVNCQRSRGGTELIPNGGWNTVDGETFGFRLDNLIFINDGVGNFSKPNIDLINYEERTPHKFIPYINKENKLTFYGIGKYVGTGDNKKIYFIEVTINNL